MTITIRDVARQAGVSVATVSRVLNRSGPVRSTTRQRVEEVAAELRYTPHGTARSLITRRTEAIGVVLPDLYGEFFSEVIRGMDQPAQRSGYHLLVSGSHDGKSEIEFALRAMRGRVDGLVVMSPLVSAAELAPSLPGSTPVVLLNCDTDGAPFHSLNLDNFGGAYGMTRHLIELGHRRIAMITGVGGNFDAAERVRGYREALRDAALPSFETLEAAGDFTEDGGYRVGRALAQQDPRPTAIFAANDSMAIGAMSALREAGLCIPGDVAVAGFDDIPIARYISPALTSVHVDVRRLGSRAVELLLDSLETEEGERPAVQEVLATTLAVRRSCGAGALDAESS